MFLDFIKRLILLCFGIYVILCILLFVFQEKLLFFPSKPYPLHYQKLSIQSELKNYTLSTDDGYILDGWAQVDRKNTKTILYFGGNGDETSYFVEKTRYKNTNIISFNYRGYALSTGKPSQKYLFSDAILIADFLKNTLKILPKDTYVMGRSLGTGVVTYLASQRDFSGIILVTPYDSVESVASEQYFFIPVKWLIRNRFPSLEYATIKKNHLLVIYGGKDATIPNWHTEKLIGVWRGSLEKIFIPNARHEDILKFPETRNGIENFIK